MEWSQSGGWLCCVTRGRQAVGLSAPFSDSVDLPSPSDKDPPYFLPITHRSVLDPLQPWNSLFLPKTSPPTLRPLLASSLQEFIAQSCLVAAGRAGPQPEGGALSPSLKSYHPESQTPLFCGLWHAAPVPLHPNPGDSTQNS